jgi:hypothetical protein
MGLETGVEGPRRVDTLQDVEVLIEGQRSGLATVNELAQHYV